MVDHCYDPLGLALHPLAALVNHSCNYNAIVRFDRSMYSQHTLTIRALRPIARDEQIVVSYIDATNPRHVRHKELQDKYFFTCECSKCSSVQVKEEGLSNSLQPNDQLLVEQQAFELLAAARKDTSITGPIQKLQYGIHILRRTYSWPLHRQPLASLRQQLVVSLIAARQLHLAFLHAWIQYRSIDPKLMPEKHHPIRLVHQWLIIALLKGIDRADILTEKEDIPIQKYNILNKSINLQTIRRHVLYDLFQKTKNDKDDIKTEASFADMVRNMYWRHTGRGHWAENSVDRTKFLEEVEKMRVCTTEILEQELVWGESTSVP